MSRIAMNIPNTMKTKAAIRLSEKFGAAAGSALRGRRRRAAAVALLVSLLLAGAVLWSSFDNQARHDACVEASRRGDGDVVEGEIRDLRPLTSYWQRPAEETFTVGSRSVRLPLVTSGCGFHRTRLEGGPLRDGLKVRLLAWRGHILRVDVDRDHVLTAGHMTAVP
jgi:hypothetical protein